MKTIKMSLANLQGKMSRKEMKNIMAGSGVGSMNCSCVYGAKFPYSSPWTWTYSSAQQMANDVTTRCINGSGGCTAAN